VGPVSEYSGWCSWWVGSKCSCRSISIERLLACASLYLDPIYFLYLHPDR
jgi:hypothetical protein